MRTHLLDLSNDVLCSVLDFAMRVDPSTERHVGERDNDVDTREQTAHEKPWPVSWLWFAQLALVCQRFNDLAIVDELDLKAQVWEYDFEFRDCEVNVRRCSRFRNLAQERMRKLARGLMSEPVVPRLLDALRTTKRLGRDVQRVVIPEALFWLSEPMMGRLMALLTSTNALPRLHTVVVCSMSPVDLKEQRIFDVASLDRLSRVHPQLFTLRLHGCLVEEEHSDAAVLSHALSRLRSLDQLALGDVDWLSDAHLVGWLRSATQPLALGSLTLAFCGRGQDGTSLSHEPDHRITDATLRALGSCAPRLRELVLVAEPFVTNAGIEAVVRGAALEQLDVSMCRGLNARCMRVLGRHAPCLHTFRAEYAHWLDDEALMELIETTRETVGGTDKIRLATLQLGYPLTQEGLYAALRAVPTLGVADVRKCVAVPGRIETCRHFLAQTFIAADGRLGPGIWTNLEIEFPEVTFTDPPYQPWSM